MSLNLYSPEYQESIINQLMYERTVLMKKQRKRTTRKAVKVFSTSHFVIKQK